MLKRLYRGVIERHLSQKHQMLLLPGPRQVGKTTLSEYFQQKYGNSVYLNWDNKDHQSIILGPLSTLAQHLNVEKEDEEKRLLVLDEIHKYPHWKSWLKGFYDTYHKKVSIVVTGSAMLNVYQVGGDSMMGRYYLYHIHPFSVAELAGRVEWLTPIQEPIAIPKNTFQNLLMYGGFPEPFLSASPHVHTQWSKLRDTLLFKEDLRDLTNIRSYSQVSILAQLIKNQVGQNVSISSLSNKLQATDPTVKTWLDTLTYIYYCYPVRPWSKNIPRSLLKEPKYYLWDWSQIKDEGARKENFVASHLYKAVQFWTDCGLGNFGLHYLRDKEKREVDFIVTKDEKPWFMVEVKSSNNGGITPAVHYFFEKTGSQHAFQLVFDEPYAQVDCFGHTKPIIVSAHTFLSQLV